MCALRINYKCNEGYLIELKPFSGIVWRILFSDRAVQACHPVSSPIGRFHHSGQTALYTSCTQEGAGIAIKRYVSAGDPTRVIVPLQINADRIYSVRDSDLSSQASMVWQGHVERGARAPTWAFSDAARQVGAQGMFYASRSRPDLTHLVLFDSGVVKQAGVAVHWVQC